MSQKSIGGAFSTFLDYAISGAWSFTAAPTIGSTGAIVSASATQTLSSKTLTAPTITTPTVTSPVVTGDAGTGLIYCKQALFTENATSTTHTATFTLPAGSTLLDIVAVPQVLWTGGTASLSIGDANSATGWFNALDLKATDLILGERLQASGGTHGWGGKPGSYLVDATGRFGQQSTNVIGGYSPTAYSVIAVVTVGTPATTAGRTRVYVLWMVGESVTPVLA